MPIIKKKSRSSWFKTGHKSTFKWLKNENVEFKCTPKPVKRLQQNVFDQIVTTKKQETVLETCDFEGVDSGIMLLRPSKPKTSILDRYMEGDGQNM